MGSLTSPSEGKSTRWHVRAGRDEMMMMLAGGGGERHSGSVNCEVDFRILDELAFPSLSQFLFSLPYIKRRPMSSAFSDYSPPSASALRGPAAPFPTSVTLNGVQVPIFKYDELERLNWNILKTKALNLKDTIISTRSGFFEHYADLTLRTTNAEQVVAWFIAVQVTICNALGYEFDASSFGAPADENVSYRAPSSNPSRRTAPCWAQEDVSNRIPSRQGHAPTKQAVYHGDAAANRCDDAARIRARQNQGSFTLG